MKKGEEGIGGDKSMLQTSNPGSPQRGHAVNLLDVVSSSIQTNV